MASPAKNTYCPENITPPATRAVKEQAARILDTTQRYAQDAYERAKRQAERSYSRVRANAQYLGRRTQEKIRTARQERPLQALAVLAGTAFVAGIAIRIWRSRVS
jgi:ElaB/YqjD/DUF883 family membrane-anchored ribosome-binding protein